MISPVIYVLREVMHMKRTQLLQEIRKNGCPASADPPNAIQTEENPGDSHEIILQKRGLRPALAPILPRMPRHRALMIRPFASFYH
jgi:hypothetical protein